VLIDKYKYPFLGRMRRPEGLPPKVVRDRRVDLGTSSEVVFEASLATSLSLVICLFLFFPAVKVDTISLPSQEFVRFEDIANTRQENRPPPPPRPLIPIETPDDQMLDDVALASTEMDITAEVPLFGQNAEENEEEYFVAVEEMPEIIGGYQSVYRRIVYPEIARRVGLQGRVFVAAFIDEKGIVTKVELVKGIGLGCDEAAMAVVKETKFHPGKQRGKPVKTRLNIPIQFQLVN
jgi:protein TonB